MAPLDWHNYYGILHMEIMDYVCDVISHLPFLRASLWKVTLQAETTQQRGSMEALLANNCIIQNLTA